MQYDGGATLEGLLPRSTGHVRVARKLLYYTGSADDVAIQDAVSYLRSSSYLPAIHKHQPQNRSRLMTQTSSDYLRVPCLMLLTREALHF